MISDDTISLLQQLAPELMEKIMLRAMVLERIAALQPVGRRALAQRLRMPEREVRSVCDSLKEDDLILVASSGMMLTEKAEPVLSAARDMVRRRGALGQLEQQLARELNVGRVCIVPGDADESDGVLREIGAAAAVRLARMLPDGAILAVSGGRTVAEIACALPPSQAAGLRVVPARGGMDIPVDMQAGALAAEFARALGGSCSLLHLPDAAPPELLRELMKLPEIGGPLNELRRADVLIYGIARADESVRSHLRSEIEAQAILRMGAVGEAAGCYFDASGRQVYQASGVGLTGEQISRVHCVVAAAGGASKAAALRSVLRHHRHELLVTDEGAACALAEML